MNPEPPADTASTDGTLPFVALAEKSCTAGDSEEAPPEAGPIFRRPDGRDLPKMHHLSRNPRGKFVLKIHVFADGCNACGTRITAQIRTDDPQEAVRFRDFGIELLKHARMVCRDVVLIPSDEM